jgi:hypothetical protein
MKIYPVTAEMFHVEGRTDRHDEANSRFSQFCESALKRERNVHKERDTEVTLYTDIVNG